MLPLSTPTPTTLLVACALKQHLFLPPEPFTTSATLGHSSIARQKSLFAHVSLTLLDLGPQCQPLIRSSSHSPIDLGLDIAHHAAIMWTLCKRHNLSLLGIISLHRSFKADMSLL